jgi:hypothetical protein
LIAAASPVPGASVFFAARFAGSAMIFFLFSRAARLPESA